MYVCVFGSPCYFCALANGPGLGLPKLGTIPTCSPICFMLFHLSFSALGVVFTVLAIKVTKAHASLWGLFQGKLWLGAEKRAGREAKEVIQANVSMYYCMKREEGVGCRSDGGCLWCVCVCLCVWGGGGGG